MKKKRVTPVKAMVVDTLNLIREQNRRGQSKQPFQPGTSPAFLMGGRDILFLGRLMRDWKTIVGPDLAKHSIPHRYIKGSLTLLISDSSWLHTFTFLRESIREKLLRLFPDQPIGQLRGMVGVIPAGLEAKTPESWPDWQESAFDAADTMVVTKDAQVSADLGKTLIECARKMAARLAGLKKAGHHLCVSCGAKLVPQSGQTCSVCLFRRHQLDVYQARVLLNESPWLTVEQLANEGVTISALEYQLIREELFFEAISRVDELLSELNDLPAADAITDIRLEMIRVLLLKTAGHPNDVSPEQLLQLMQSSDSPTDSPADFVPDTTWKDFLIRFPGGIEC
jgi:hypothetical protein